MPGVVVEVMRRGVAFGCKTPSHIITPYLDGACVAIHSERSGVFQPRHAQDDLVAVHVNAKKVDMEADTMASYGNVPINSVVQERVTTS